MRTHLGFLAVVVVLGCGGCSTRDEPARACNEPYGACRDRSECPARSSCQPIEWRDGRGSICTVECSDELDCTSIRDRPARCLDVNGTGVFRCFQACGRDAVCPTGHVCQPLSSHGSVCLP